MFTLDALADDSHRRHLINQHTVLGDFDADLKPDWRAYYDACEGDAPIYPSWCIFNGVAQRTDVQIWSGRCESVREKTIHWLMNKCPLKPTYWNEESWSNVLKLRPIGDDRPQEELFKLWKNDFLSEPCGYQRSIDMVFSSHKPTINMFRKCGVFVFDCNQNL